MKKAQGHLQIMTKTHVKVYKKISVSNSMKSCAHKVATFHTVLQYLNKKYD